MRGEARARGQAEFGFRGAEFADELNQPVDVGAGVGIACRLRCRPFRGDQRIVGAVAEARSEEHTSELQSLMRNSYAVFCLNKKLKSHHENTVNQLLYSQNLS